MISVLAEVVDLDLHCLPTQLSNLGQLFKKMVVFIYLAVQRAGAILHCSAEASYCGGFACWGAQTAGHEGFSSFRMWAQ